MTQKVAGFVPARIKGKLHGLMNLVRMFLITLSFVFSFTRSDLVVVDQITLPIPLLRLFRYKVLYYCHFPEALLNDNKPSKLGAVYRFILDTIEVVCLYFASVICFNSYYTKENVEHVFPSVKKRATGKYVVYPCMQTPPAVFDSSVKLPSNFVLSLNRFESRKRIDVAVRAFAAALKTCKEMQVKDARLVLAGGLDLKNADAVKCRAELEALATELGVADKVVFMENINETQKEALLR